MIREHGSGRGRGGDRQPTRQVEQASCTDQQDGDSDDRGQGQEPAAGANRDNTSANHRAAQRAVEAARVTVLAVDTMYLRPLKKNGHV